IPFASTTPSASDARNFAGIVSRFFASRVWSKVPRKAIGHRACPASPPEPNSRSGAANRIRRTAAARPASMDADRGGGVGGAPPPRSAATLLPHNLPLRNSICTFSPTRVHHLTPRRSRSPWRWAIAGGGDRRRGTARLRKRRCRRAVCTRPCSAMAGSVRPLCLRGGAAWEARGYDESSMSRTLRRPTVLLLVALAAVASGVAGCASAGDSGGATDPAALVPSSAPLYAETVLAGDDQEQADAQAARRRVPRPSDPRGALARILRTSAPRGKLPRLFDRGNANFARDVEPWLGDRVGAAALAFGGRSADNVVVAVSRDDAPAGAAPGRLLPNAQRRSYRGVDYRVATGRRGFAAAVVEHAVVFGTENALKAAIDASKGESLAETDGLKQARDKVREERSAFLYVDVAGVLRGALSAAGGQAAQLAPF